MFFYRLFDASKLKVKVNFRPEENSIFLGLWKFKHLPMNFVWSWLVNCLLRWLFVLMIVDVLFLSSCRCCSFAFSTVRTCFSGGALGMIRIVVWGSFGRREGDHV